RPGGWRWCRRATASRSPDRSSPRVSRAARLRSQPVVADLLELHGDRRLVAALADVRGERAECRDLLERIARRVGAREMHEADPVGLLECGVAEVRRARGGELGVDSADQALVLGDAIGFDLVTDDGGSHIRTTTERPETIRSGDGIVLPGSLVLGPWH